MIEKETLINENMKSLREQVTLTVQNEEKQTRLFSLAQHLPVEIALENLDLFKPWNAGEEYEDGVMLTYGGGLFKNTSGRKSQGEEPELSTVWTQVRTTETYPEWYHGMIVDRNFPVSHKGKNYISSIDGNTTEPGTNTSWTEI